MIKILKDHIKTLHPNVLSIHDIDRAIGGISTGPTAKDYLTTFSPPKIAVMTIKTR
jgi:hypothetical protein